MSPRRSSPKSEHRVTRRELLATAGVGGSLLLGGCATAAPGRDDGPTSTASGDSTGTPTPSPSATEPAMSTSTPFEDARASPAPTCPDGYEPTRPSWVVEGPGPLAGFELRLTADTLERGETLTVRLVNVTAASQTTGNRKKYDLQHRSDGEWYSVFATDPDAFHTDEAVSHPPGDGFRWELPLSRDGLTDAVDTGPTYYVCEPLAAGDYRFVYWGVTSKREAETNYETEYALGVPFNVV